LAGRTTRRLGGVSFPDEKKLFFSSSYGIFASLMKKKGGAPMKAGFFEDYKMLLAKLEQLKDECLALASDLPALAADLQEGRLGLLKNTAERILFLEKSFEAYKKEALSLPGAETSPPDVDNLTTLEDMETLLQSFHIQMRQDALQILDDVLSIFHKDKKDYQALQNCHAKARALQQAIEEIELPGLHPDVPALLNGAHPFSELLLLVRHHRNLDEERIEELEDHIQNYFGRLMFLAIVRDKLDFALRPAAQQDQAPAPSEAEQIVKKTVESGDVREVSFPAPKKTGAAEDRTLQKPRDFPRVETIFQQPPSLGRRESVSKPVLKKDRSDENRNATLKDLTQTKFKLERALEYGFIQRNEYEQSGGVIQEIEASLPDKTDFTEDRKNLLTIQTMLDEKESSTVETRRLDVQQELEELSQTRLKLERALKYGFIQKNEHESLTDDINAIEASLPGKTDFTQDRKMLLTIRNMLDEKELSTVEARRLAMRKEFQQIKNSFLTNKPATSSNN
jgi:hypothetical protein